ncbi:MAG: hypothetical protein K8R21_15265 [Leptospira sp.]|nr:hypothetical protein [Leptospira sp.]
MIELAELWASMGKKEQALKILRDYHKNNPSNEEVGLKIDHTTNLAL